MTFYGNQHFKFVTPGGKIILIDPWVKGNPDWPQDLRLEELKKVDAIFVSVGHGDATWATPTRSPSSPGRRS